MNMFGIRRIFRALHGVKYTRCETCGDPISSVSPLHYCELDQVVLPFFHMKLTETSRSVHFNDRPKGHGFLHEVKVWTGQYVNGIEVCIEDPKNKKFIRVRRGDSSGKFFRIRMAGGEFVKKVEFGCDFNGMYYFGIVTNRQELLVGDMERPARMFEFPENFGLVGIFGAFTEKILHLGFFYDDMKDVNWARHRELILIRAKGQATERNDLNLILKLDDNLVRYLASFI